MSDGAQTTHEAHETDEARALHVVRGLGARPTTVLRLSGGAMNSVLRVVGDGTDWVVRSPLDLTRPDVFPSSAGRLRLPGPAGSRSPRCCTSGPRAACP
ncbi:hypothetical protein ASG53_13545 [Sanguibacter sp. Leaf3]|nr:hypothetical protein ASG53_13545 [Sanguibacter sp. Leaf3]